MKFCYSLAQKDKETEAITCKNGKIKFFLANLDRFDPDKDFEKYIAYLIATEFHELGHFFNPQDGCNDKDHDSGICLWCEEKEKIFQYIAN